MSAVGIVTIALGVLGVCGSGGLLVAPEAYFGWLKETIASNARIRMLGAFVMALGGAVVWASTSEDSVLGIFLTIYGWVCLAFSAPLMVLFPGVYLAIVKTLVPSEPSGNLTLWRLRGLAGVVAGLKRRRPGPVVGAGGRGECKQHGQGENDRAGPGHHPQYSTGRGSRLRHKYQVATERQGRQ